jgi:hypothetical protein
VQEQDALLGAVTLGGRLEDAHHLHQRRIQTIDRVGAAVFDVVEEAIADHLAFVLAVFFHPVRHDHVVHALERGTGDPRVLNDEIEILVEGSLPVQLLELFDVLPGLDETNDVVRGAHDSSCTLFRGR